MKHGTPKEVVSIIKKHIPRNAKKVLEPSVGEGALIEPFISRNFNQLNSITLVDINPDRLQASNAMLNSLNASIESVCGDYLQCFDNNKKFDCIIMNPPFDAKKANNVYYQGIKLPIEAAFISKSLDHLLDNGTLITILPASIIYGDSLVEFRKKILKQLKILKVYELNKYSFPGIEGKFYILIAKKARSSSSLSLEKPFSDKTVTIKINNNLLVSNDYRLDFSYYFSQTKLNEILEDKNYSFYRLNDIASISRGRHPATKRTSNILHTNHYQDHYWDLNDFDGSHPINAVIANNQDILLKRISRNCQRSFGIMNSGKTPPISDCVFRIRPNQHIDQMELLFSLRCMYANDFGKQILVKGTGANYITAKTLSSLPIAVNLSSLYPSEFQSYTQHIASGNFSRSLELESDIFHQISR